MFRENKELAIALAKVELLTEENQRLREQVKNLQDALVSATAPVAYSSIIAKRAETEYKNSPEFEEHQKELQYMKAYRDALPGDNEPIFRSADEFINYLKRPIPTEIERKLEMESTSVPDIGSFSSHGNEES